MSWPTNPVVDENAFADSICQVGCSGFSSLRPECVADPCLAQNMCRLNPNIMSPEDFASDTLTCADWCCVPHSVASVAIVLLVAGSAFLVLVGCYFAYLHTQDERRMKEDAMNEAIEAATTAPSTTLQNARRRLQQFAADRKADAQNVVTAAEMAIKIHT